LKAIVTKIPQAGPEAVELQNEVARLLAAEKAHIQRFEKTRATMDELKVRCEDYKYKWGIAKRQLAKVQSQTTQYLEWQTKKSNPAEPVEPVKTNGERASVPKEPETPIYDEFEAERKAMKAEAAKRKEQLEALEEENSKLNVQLTTANSKLTSLTDDDYAKTDLFISLKAQHEDVIKRINNLEALNTQLREEAQKLQSERTAYKLQIDEECRANCTDMEGRMAHLEEDVQRLRSERDAAHMAKTMLENSQVKHDESLSALKSINVAHEERVKALESEVSRLKVQIGEETIQPTADLTEDVLRKEHAQLQHQVAALNKELESMQVAVTKFRQMAQGKKDTILAIENEVQRLRESKNRLDLNRFAEKQAMDTRRGETEALRKQRDASAQAIAQIKESEAGLRLLTSTLEKQTADFQLQVNSLTESNNLLNLRMNDAKLAKEAMASQVAELTKTLVAKDSALVEVKHAQREAEAEAASYKAKAADAKKKLDEWRSKGSNKDDDHVEMLRVSFSALSKVLYYANKRPRKRLSVIRATLTSKTLSSRPAGTSYATIVHKVASKTDNGNVQCV
jgi:E3 ubiquitin-protein ligase BRE1